MQTVHIETKVTWKCFKADSGNWIAACDPLKLTVQSTDLWADLMEDISITLDALLRDLLASNELTTFLRDRGWVFSGKLPARPEEARFDVPFIPDIVNRNGFQGTLHQ